jgi:hypothetical protein
MRVGVVNMNPSLSLKNYKYCITALEQLGHTPVIIHAITFSTEELFDIIQKSTIKKWLFTGSIEHIHKTDIKVPMDILKLPKDFLLVCFSMQSFITQLLKNVSLLRERYERRKEYFIIKKPPHPSWLFENTQDVQKQYRNHNFYFRTGTIYPVQELFTYRGEVMLAMYKNFKS